jgi:hypothetical protein
MGRYWRALALRIGLQHGKIRILFPFIIFSHIPICTFPAMRISAMRISIMARSSIPRLQVVGCGGGTYILLPGILRPLMMLLLLSLLIWGSGSSRTGGPVKILFP